VHIDGYISVCAETVIVKHKKIEEVEVPSYIVKELSKELELIYDERINDVLHAVYYGSELALRFMRTGMRNTEVTSALEKVASFFHCSSVRGILSHSMERFEMDGDKIILSKFEEEQMIDEFIFTPYQAYAIDIVMSTGNGIFREGSERTNIFKRDPKVQYKVKSNSSKKILNEIKEKFFNFPFNIRNTEDIKITKVGLVELTKHNLVKGYPVITEIEGEYVAQSKFTVLVLPQSTIRLTRTMEKPTTNSKYNIESDPDLQKMLQMSIKKKRRRNQLY